MKSLAESFEIVRRQIADDCIKADRDPESVALLAVSKTRSTDEIRAAAATGQTSFGENYLQEALEKIEALEELGLEWHFIGPIQSNKTRPIAENFHWVHSVDRLKIAQRLSDQRPHYANDLNICIQVNISAEEQKAGCSVAELPQLAREIAALPKICLRGLMVIPEATEDLELLRSRFRETAQLLAQLKPEIPTLDTLSMGMSGDLDVAIAEGATMVRVGTALFGPRNSPRAN
ncbi:MAG: YggS family pyridoxal phosphate-dependent enzyme [Oceanospirillaceae bacterium]|nr:YggS family pyridoxal phosphate-dependent enzyme [Oceanospirillaceae bacterium]